MGQKIHPIGFRIGVIRGWDSHWFSEKNAYAAAVLSDDKIRKYIAKKLGKGIVSHIEIERAANRIKVTIHTSRPGVVIGRGGKGIDELTNSLNKMVRKEEADSVVQINVTEVRQPELDAQLVAENVAIQLERRVAPRRIMRQTLTRAKRMNARGLKIMLSGRLGGAEIARTEHDRIGKIPLHTLRADVDYGTATAFTIYGTVGVKIWIYKGEILPEKQRAKDAAAVTKKKSDDKSKAKEELTVSEKSDTNLNPEAPVEKTQEEKS